MKVLDLFAGCGGFSKGFADAGYDIVAFVEQWKPAIETYKKNHPHAIHLGKDIQTIEYEIIAQWKNRIDLIIGGPPCQGFSYCGKRDPKDKRNQLYKEFLRFVAIIKPKLVVIENVSGLLSMKDQSGEKILHKIIEALIEIQYAVTYKIINAAQHGVPQHRQRLIIIAQRSDLFPKEEHRSRTVLEVLADIPKNCNAHEHFTPTEKTIERIKILRQGERICKKFNVSRQRLYGDRPSKTIVTKPLYIHPIEDRFLTPRELARLQSFPDGFLFCGSKIDKVKQIGNAMPPLLARKLAEKLKEVFV